MIARGITNPAPRLRDAATDSERCFSMNTEFDSRLASEWHVRSPVRGSNIANGIETGQAASHVKCMELSDF